MIKLTSLVLGLGISLIGSSAFAACVSRNEMYKIFHKTINNDDISTLILKDVDVKKITPAFNRMQTYYKQPLEEDVTEIFVGLKKTSDETGAIMIFIHNDHSCTDDVRMVKRDDFMAMIMDAYNMSSKKPSKELAPKKDDGDEDTPSPENDDSTENHEKM